MGKKSYMIGFVDMMIGFVDMMSIDFYLSLMPRCILRVSSFEIIN
jgi:hypothetical protein